MKTRLLAFALLAIAGFAVADLVRAATSGLATYLAGSAAENIAHASTSDDPANVPWRTASGL